MTSALRRESDPIIGGNNLARMTSRLSLLIALTSAVAGVATAQTIQAPYSGSYSYVDLGSAPGVPANYGGITFHPTNANVIMLGGAANGGAGAVYSVNVVRGAGNHITGFSGSGTQFCTAANIDGGLQFGPNNVLFATTYANNLLHQIPAGQPGPTKSIDLTAAGIWPSTGSLQITPPGFVGAGKLRILSYSGSTWNTATLVPDGSGTFNLSNVVTGPILGGGLEGMIYPPSGSPNFANFSQVLVVEWGTGSIVTYTLDANGDPIPATRTVFMNGLSGAEGATIDPVTGDFLFSTFGGGNRVLAVRGFAVPTCNGSSATYGTPTAGSGGFVPQLAVLGTPCVGNALSALQLTQGLGAAPCVLFTGFSPANIPLPYYGGTIWLNQVLTSGFGILGAPGVPGAGNFTANLPIPNDAFLSGLNIYLQAVLIDAGAARGVSFTKGLQVTIG